MIKVFIFEEPVNCNVTFNAPESLEATVTYDRVKTLDKLADGLACFKGTEVAIEGADDLTVKVGETELEKEQRRQIRVHRCRSRHHSHPR